MLSLSVEIQRLLTLNLRPCVILTVGNSLRSDDAVGPYIASKLLSSKDILIINAECNPESSLEQVINFKPKSILIIDAANFGGSPGDVELIDKKHIPETSVSTHLISLKVIAGVLYQDTKAQISFLGIQPKNVTLGQDMCKEVRMSADDIIAQINLSI